MPFPTSILYFCFRSSHVTGVHEKLSSSRACLLILVGHVFFTIQITTWTICYSCFLSQTFQFFFCCSVFFHINLHLNSSSQLNRKECACYVFHQFLPFSILDINWEWSHNFTSANKSNHSITYWTFYKKGHQNFIFVSILLVPFDELSWFHLTSSLSVQWATMINNHLMLNLAEDVL